MVFFRSGSLGNFLRQALPLFVLVGATVAIVVFALHPGSIQNPSESDSASHSGESLASFFSSDPSSGTVVSEPSSTLSSGSPPSQSAAASSSSAPASSFLQSSGSAAPTPTHAVPTPTHAAPTPTATPSSGQAILIDHTYAKLSDIPATYLTQARNFLHIAYGHTSHGSQLITGMDGLTAWKGSAYAFNDGGTGGALDLRDTPFTGAEDLGNPDFAAWAAATRNYLNSHGDINVVMWSWCGQVSGASEEDINGYLSRMNALENDYPNVRFVYFTGHLDGGGLTGNLHLRNEQIRAYCRNHQKILYDFADIESYDPDGTYFGDRNPTDNCDYTGGNWATEWQSAHTEGVDWYDCDPAHTQPLNGNLKAYAAWALFARLAGWSGK